MIWEKGLRMSKTYATHVHFDVRTAARMYRIPLVDYCEHDAQPDRWGVLIGSGCGLMMAVMDHVRFRYCIDADTLDLHEHARAYALAQFVTLASVADDGGVALAGWFSISDPVPLREAFAHCPVPGVVYTGHARIGVPGEVDTLEQFITAAKRRWDPFTKGEKDDRSATRG